ncbi:MAG TPA: PQQ-dependent dehydrogenase, methanol/ethanol family [Stellaceae bacterium]
MLRKPRISVIAAAAGGLALLLSAATGSAQKALPPAPRPETPAPVPPILQNYKPVTAQELKQPADGEWPMYRRTYNGWGYSPLAEITAANVGQLKMVWTLETGQVEGHQAPPIVRDGVMFVATPGNQVLAVDAKAGNLLWRFKRPIPEDMLLLHPTSRGVGLWGDKVYFAAADAVLVALDAKTGKEVWKTKVEDYTHGYYMSLSPLVVDGVVMIGCSGGELGVRGFVAAFDADTGKQLWKTYTVPAPGEPGSDTWPKGDQWKTGGGSVWIEGNYDPDTNLAYWGTGNGGPWMGDQRPGDNLYTSSVMALDVKTGAIKGYYQYHPNDSWDWDEVSPPILVDYQHDGKSVKGLVDVARDGYLWMLARTDGPIGFVAGEPFVKQNVFASLDPKTGRPNVDPVRKPATGKKADFCPSLWGGKDWPPVAYSPKTRLLYIPANENLCGTSIGEKVSYTPGERFVGATTTLYVAPGADHIGELQAWNLDTGKKVWSHPFANSQLWGPVLATGGGLVFAGGTNDRYFRAFDASTGKTLWEFRTGSGVNGVPVSFELDGKQYIAVQSGWGVDAARMQARLNLVRQHQFPEVPQGGAIWVFAVQ